MGKTNITVNDALVFRTIAEACNFVFNSDYQAMQQAFFVPKNLKKEYGDKYIAWFFTASLDGSPNGTGWINRVSGDGRTINEMPKNHDEAARKWLAEYETTERLWRPRITFAKFGKEGYRFIGVFKTQPISGDHVEHKRIDDTFPLSL